MGLKLAGFVSISQSRYFSFQGLGWGSPLGWLWTTFQSRNRDTFLFKSKSVACILPSKYFLFQSRNRDTFLFKNRYARRYGGRSGMFQSRNRDTFLFKECQEVMTKEQKDFLFQSRNRDTFLFKLWRIRWAGSRSILRGGFNLAIEILFFSRKESLNFGLQQVLKFQSRNRDTFLFKGVDGATSGAACVMFQSRNRDTFLFKLNPNQKAQQKVMIVSISQSRYFSFQVKERIRLEEQAARGFNLAIEILFFSRSSPFVPVGLGFPGFQSRNRDTFLFKDVGEDSIESCFLCVSISQSRYFSFQEDGTISPLQFGTIVSISQSRYFSFQGWKVGTGKLCYKYVSISQSRYFSFQGIDFLFTYRSA